MSASFPAFLDVFRRHRKTRRSNRRLHSPTGWRRMQLHREQLERRLALAIDVFQPLGSSWLLVTSDGGSDIYLQQVATDKQNLLIADNPSFNNYRTIADIDNTVTTLKVTSGAHLSVTNLPNVGLGDSPTTSFVLADASISRFQRIAGTVSYGGNIWNFTTNGNGGSTLAFTLASTSPTATSNPTLIRPVSGVVVSAADNSNVESGYEDGGFDTVQITWSAPPDSVAGPQVTATYSYFDGFGNLSGRTVTGATVSSGVNPTFQLPVTSKNPGGVVPGTLSGEIHVGGGSLKFRTNAADSGVVPLWFDSFNLVDRTVGLLTIPASGSAPSPARRIVTGTLDTDTGIISLNFNTTDFVIRGVWNGQRFVDGYLTVAAQDPGPVTISADYATVGQDAAPNTVTLFPGQDFSRELFVDLLTPGSTFNINSRFPQAVGTTGISVSATNVNVNAQTTSNNRFNIGPTSLDLTAILATASARAVVSAGGTISRVYVPAGLGGQGYDNTPANAPLVTITGGGGTGATATAVVQNGVVVGITVVTAGTGYTSLPTVTIAAPRAATATATVGLTGTITAITPGYGGQGYDHDPAKAPLVTITGGGGTGATATAVVTNGVVTSINMITAGTGYTSSPTVTIDPPPTLTLVSPVPEQVNFNAAVSANSYDIRLGDEPATSGVNRGRLFVSPSGSLAGAGSVYVQANTADVFVEGTIDAASQTYLMQSPSPVASAVAVLGPGGTIARIDVPTGLGGRGYDNDPAKAPHVTITGGGGTGATATAVVQNGVVVGITVVTAGTGYTSLPTVTIDAPTQAPAPFFLTTKSPTTGVDTGLVRGTNVAVTLANNLATPDNGGAASNIVSLRTDVGSLRITAANLGGPTAAFPYELSINELNDLVIDAVPASSGRIAITADGGITLNSALATDGDLAISAGSNFTVSAPLSTTRGQIAIGAQNLTVSNSLRVLDPAVDSYVDDIVLTATGGTLNLTGAISAVNNVRLVQRNALGAGATVGSISGPTRIIARGVAVDADGSVDVRTAADFLQGTAGGAVTLDELDDITISSLQAGGLVTLRAGGVDPGLGNVLSPNGIALTATLQGVTALDVSAPKGSVSVITNTDHTLALGNAQTIAAGTAASMVAAGSVEVRSIAGPIDIADAPIAGSGGVAVRVATAAPLPAATFAYNTPGLLASTLTATAVGPLVVDGITVRANDRVLVQNQANAWENGVYVVTTVGSNGPPGRPWVLTRATDVDTTAELPANSIVRVTEGTSAGQVFQIGYTQTFGTSPLVATAVANHSGAARVRVATTTALPGTYDRTARTITGSGLLPAIDGVTLVVGNRVLVRLGALTTTPAGLPAAAANGVYEVTSDGSGGFWTLTRAIDVDTSKAIETGYVAVSEGTFRSATTGLCFLISYDSLGIDPMTVVAKAGGRPVTNIGSNDFSDTATFVVSSTAGTNDAAGSLGKMIRLYQVNDTGASANPPQKTDFKFSTLVDGPIVLTQELPVISEPLALDGAVANRYVPPGTVANLQPISVNGASITTTNVGTGVFRQVGTATVVGPATISVPITFPSFEELRVGMTVQGVGIVPGSRIASIDSSARRVTLSSTIEASLNASINVTFATEVNGFQFAPGSTSTTAGSRLANLYVGGFTTGTAVRITAPAVSPNFGGTPYAVTLDGVTIGQSSAGARLTDEFGVLVAGAGSARITNGEITSSDGAGIRTQDTATGVVVTGMRIGKSGFPNVTGVDLAGSGTVVIGSATATPTESLAALRNTIAFNRSGVVLRAGTNRIVNTTIASNSFDGVQILGGNYQIGGSTTLDAASNEIVSNGDKAIEILTGADPANPQTDARRIQGNYLSILANETTAANLGGTIYASSLANTRRLGLRPRASGLDAFGNRHGALPTRSMMYISTPWDNLESDLDTRDNRVRVTGNAAYVTRVALGIEDGANALDDTSVATRAFIVQYSTSRNMTDADWNNGTGVTTLAAGTDYTFVYDPANRQVSLDAPLGLALGSYRILVDNSATTGIRDNTGNVLLNNDVAGPGTTAFVVVIDSEIDQIPALALALDTGVSATDGISMQGVVNVTNLLPGATWQYSLDRGDNWSDGTGASFTLPADAAYAAGQVRVRQFVGPLQSFPGANAAPIVIDTSAPAAAPVTAVTDDVPRITGVVPDGGVTNDAILTLSGTTETGTVVEVFNGATKLGNATVNGVNWTFTTAALTDGVTYAFKTRATDIAGNVGPDSATYSVAIDLTPPAAPMIASVVDDVAPVTGLIPPGGVTNDATPTLSGTTDNGTQVEIFNGANKLGDAIVNGVNWTFTTAPLADGVTVFTARAIDGAGNVGPDSTTYSVTIDTAGPPAPVILSVIDDILPTAGTVTPGGYTNDTVLDLVGTTTIGTLVEIFDGANKVGDAIVNGTAWTFTAGPLVEGATYAFTARAINAAGNPSLFSAPYPVTIDTVAPSVVGFDTGVAAGAYGIGAAIPITATMNEVVAAGSTLLVTLNTGVQVTLVAAAQGIVLGGTYTVPAGQDTDQLAVVAMNADGVRDLADNVADGTFPAANLPAGIIVDGTVPNVLRYESTTVDGTYGIGAAINITAVASEPVRAGSTMTVTLSTGAQVTLVAASAGTTLSGTYVVQAGQGSADLDVVAVNTLAVRDVAGNAVANAAGGLYSLATARSIAISGGVGILTPAGFSTNPALVPDRRVAVTSIPITFNTPVTGFTLANLSLKLGIRTISLRGAKLTGSGANYVLTIPAKLTSLKGIYTLRINAAGIVAAGNGSPMMANAFIYWGKGRKVG